MPRDTSPSKSSKAHPSTFFYRPIAAMWIFWSNRLGCDETRREYATGTLILAVREDRADVIKTLDDLTKPSIGKIAIANPRFAPYGRAAKQALERAKIWDRVSNKIVEAESVRQALQFVESGNADAGLVGRAIADVPRVRIVAVNPSLHEPIVQSLGVVADSKNIDAAEAFAHFLIGADGRERLARFGFKPPPSR